MKTLLQPGFWSTCIVALLVVANSQYVTAQVGTPTINIFPPAPRSLRQNLVRAKKAIEEDRFSDAVAELGLVLTGTDPDQPVGAGDENQDFFIELPGQSGTQTSLKAEAQRMLGTLPPRGRELFELQFGADARALLDSAVQGADVNELNEVVRRYFHTTAGYEAALLLGRLHLDHGRPLAAALCLQRVANVPNVAARFEPELSLLLAACWQLARQSTQAQSTLAGLPGRLPHGQVRLGDAELRELPRTQDAVAWLTEHFRTISPDDAEIGQWPLFRGNSSRNAARSGGLPLKRSRWQVPLVIDAHDRGLIEELRIGFVEQGSPVLPVVQPLAVGNVVLMRSSERLVGIDFQTGKRIWEYPFGDLSPEEELQNSNPLMPPQNAREKRLTTLRERLWQDTPFGQVSSDGNSVYLLDDMRQSAPQAAPRMRGIRGGRGMGFQIEPSILQNELVALDLQKEGYMMWIVGGDKGGVEPRLAGVFFLGPPLPLFGSLYLVAELKGELRLVVLDAATGKQQWSQQLAHMEAILGMDEQVRRFSGATPSFADGVLVCPTSAGAIVAVDIATRHLLWGYQYSSNRDGFGRQPFMQFPMQPTFPLNRWQDASVTISEGSVLITPAEADFLICLDLLTGKPRWEPLPRNRDLADMLYVAGIYDGSAVLVAKDRVVALRLKDGKPAWKEPAKLQNTGGEMPSGRGFLSDHHYYLPTTKSDLVKIDLRDGQIVERTKTDHVLGNLICFRDEIVSVAADRAATFYQIEPLRKNVEMKLSKSPDDAWALARQGELLVHDGRTAEALGVLHKAHDRNPQDEGVRSLLVDTFLAALQDDFGKHGAMAAQIADLIDNDPQRARYLMLVAAGYHRTGDLVAAADHYAKLIRLTAASAKKIPAGEVFSLIATDANSSVRADRFLSARLDELYSTGDSQVREHLDALVRELGVQANSGSVAELRHFLQLCGFHAAADDQRVNLAGKLIETGDLLEAELALAPLLRRSGSPLGGQALALATRIYTLGKKPRMLAAVYVQLRSGWGDVPVLNGKTGRQLSEEAVAVNLDYPTAGDEWPWGLTKMTDTRDAARQNMYPIHPCFSLLERRGAALDKLKLEFDAQRGNTHLRDGNGTEVLRLPHLEPGPQIEAGLWRTAADDHLLFAAVGRQIVAIDTLRPRSNEIEATLWRETLWNTEADSMKPLPREHRNPFDPSHLQDYRWGDATGRPVASVGPMTARGVCFQKIRAITCLDPLSGATLWSRNDFDQGCELFGDDELIFIQSPVVATRKPEPKRSATTTAADPATVVAPLEIECSVVSAVDGRLLGKRRLPAPANRWTIRGRNVLAWEQKEADIRLFLYDVNRQADVWSENFPAGSRGCLIDNDSVAVLQPSGRLVIRSLTGDVEKLDTTVQPTNGLVGIQVLPSSHQLLLIVNDSQPLLPEPETGRRLVQQVLLPVNGRIFALDRVTGRSLWQVPAIVRGYGMLPNQPEDVPALWFLRPGATPSNQFGSNTARVDVLCLDRRTGSALLEKVDVASHANSFDVIADVRKNEVTLALPQVQYTLRFTTDPQPPAPPFQQSRNGNRVDAALKKIGGLIETFKDVLIPIPKMDPFK